MIVSIDPGLNTGWAIWSAAGLVACGLGDPRSCLKHVVTSESPHVDVVDDLWIEVPVIYPRSKAAPNDVVKLALNAGIWCGRYDCLGVTVHTVTPAEWKGQVPKDVHHARVWSKLAPADQAIVARACQGMAASKRHNVLDAVALGQWARGKR